METRKAKYLIFFPGEKKVSAVKETAFNVMSIDKYNIMTGPDNRGNEITDLINMLTNLEIIVKFLKEADRLHSSNYDDLVSLLGITPVSGLCYKVTEFEYLYSAFKHEGFYIHPDMNKDRFSAVVTEHESNMDKFKQAGKPPLFNDPNKFDRLNDTTSSNERLKQEKTDHSEQEKTDYSEEDTTYENVVLRAEFAGQAMQGLISAGHTFNQPMTLAKLTKSSVACANALITELNKTNHGNK